MFTQVEMAGSLRQRVVIAHEDPAYAALIGRHFRRLGWEVYGASSGPSARRLTRYLNPAAVVLDTDLTEESGWLTCDKLTRELPGPRVILVSKRTGAEQEAFAEFVGAMALVAQADGVPALVNEVLGVALSAAG
jgi:DNA-binding response OmpR family regulator